MESEGMGMRPSNTHLASKLQVKCTLHSFTCTTCGEEEVEVEVEVEVVLSWYELLH